MSTSLHTFLVAKTRLADGELLQVAVNRKEFLKLRERSIIQIDGQHLKPE